MSNNNPHSETDERQPNNADSHSDSHNDGEWLEHQMEAALRRWGYSTELHQTAYGLEVDVIARRREEQQKPTDCIVAQCKNWNSDSITPQVIYRLCMVAFGCQATPVLCHTTELTDRARRIADDWEVRVLTLDDLHSDSLPAPRIYRSDSTDVDSQSQSRSTIRETRDHLPVLFSSGSTRQFTYVPGFEPSGVEHRYRPVDEVDTE